MSTNFLNIIKRNTALIINIGVWGVMGTGLGFSAALYVPNYPPKRAALAGAIGGTLGGTIYVAMMGVGVLGTLIGIIVLGAAIGLAISYKIVMEDRLTNRRSDLYDGDKVDLGRVSIVVHTKGKS